MKRILLSLSFVVLASSFSSCATAHLWRWGFDKSSVIHKVDDEEIAAFIKPASTIVGTPLTVVWDVVTFPFQLGFQVYPYLGQRHLAPSERGE